MLELLPAIRMLVVFESLFVIIVIQNVSLIASSLLLIFNLLEFFEAWLRLIIFMLEAWHCLISHVLQPHHCIGHCMKKYKMLKPAVRQATMTGQDSIQNLSQRCMEQHKQIQFLHLATFLCCTFLEWCIYASV